MEQTKFSREEFYDLVWTESLLSISKRYEITVSGLRKKCHSMNIPNPEPGYWAKIKWGYKVKKKNLPSKYIGKPEIILKTKMTIDEAKKSPKVLLDALEKIISEENKDLLVVPEQLRSTEPLIIRSKEMYVKKEFWIDHGLIVPRYRPLDFKVAPENLRRALLIWDTLIKVLTARGYKVEYNSSKTYLVKEGDRVYIFMREKLKKIQLNNQWRDTAFQPTGILAITIESGYNNIIIQDGEQKLEERLSRIVAKIELSIEQQKEWRLDREKKEKERLEKERIKRELKERKEKELADFIELFKKAKRWKKAENIRNYVQLVEDKSIDNQTEEFKNWLIWARKKADWLDPFIEAEDELLREVDKNTFNFTR